MSDRPPSAKRGYEEGRYVQHAESLEGLSRRTRRRRLIPRAGWDFSSNDYLGLASSPELRAALERSLIDGVGVGSGGSRLLRGNDPEHEALEAEAASFFGAQSSLYFASGFAANNAIFATLPQRGDLIVHDELIHASVHDGLRMTRGEARMGRHNDPQAFDDVIASWRSAGGRGRVWMSLESLYSMDGDAAPLAAFVEVAERHEATLVIDEAHATGVLGPEGRGLAAHLEGRHDVITLHTCGKALGLMGGLVCGPRLLMDFLVNRCRPFIYSTAPSPLMAAGVRAALRIVQGSERRMRHKELVAHAGRVLSDACDIVPTGTHIQPVILGQDARALQVAERLQLGGFDVRAIRPPTVPEGTSRLRISLTLNVTAAAVDDLAAALRGSLDG